MEGLIPVAVLGLIVLAIGSMIWHLGRARDILEMWATENGYTILERRRRTLWRGPFFMTTNKGQEVYSVTVRDAGGKVRRGYVRVGGWMLGALAQRVAVRWQVGGAGMAE